MGEVVCPTRPLVEEVALDRGAALEYIASRSVEGGPLLKATLQMLGSRDWRAYLILPIGLGSGSASPARAWSPDMSKLPCQDNVSQLVGACWDYGYVRISEALRDHERSVLLIEDAVPAHAEGEAVTPTAPVEYNVWQDTQYWWIDGPPSTPTAIKTAFLAARTWLEFAVVTHIKPWEAHGSALEYSPESTAGAASLLAIDAMDQESLMLVHLDSK